MFKAPRRLPLMYATAPMMRAGATPPRIIDGAAASTSTSGSQPPAAMHRLRTEPIRAAERAARACCSTRAPKSAVTEFSPPQAVTSRRPDTALAAESAIASSPITDMRWRTANGRSSSRRISTEARIGGMTYGSVTGTSVTSPASVLPAVKTNVQATISTPA